jgi:hypothetical protein
MGISNLPKLKMGWKFQTQGNFCPQNKMGWAIQNGMKNFNTLKKIFYRYMYHAWDSNKYV